MERGFVLLLPLCLGLLQRGRGQSLEVEPPQPTVAVALGGSLLLTCRLACPRGEAVSVQWRGLDTSLGEVQATTHSSVLSVSGASLATAGTRVCVGHCGPHNFQSRVELLVYAFPDQLSVSPAVLVPGRDQEVACIAHNVTPVDSDTLFFSLLLGERELEGVRALGQEEEPLEDEDMLFRVTARWLLPPLGTPAPATLHCQATMKLPGLELSHRWPIPVLHSPAVPDPPAPVPPTTATLEAPTTAAPALPTMAVPEALTTAALQPLTMATAALGTPTAASMEPPATATSGTPAMAAPGTSPWLPQGPLLQPTARNPAAASMEPPATATLGTPAMAAPEIPTPATVGQGSTHDPSSPSPRTPPSPCRPEIHQPPTSSDRESRLELLCMAACGSGVAVRWIQAPGGLAAYERREVGARAWLTLLQAGRSPEGWFQCRLHPGGQVASLYLLPESRASPNVDAAALWTGSSILGLILLAFLARRLRRRCRSRG